MKRPGYNTGAAFFFLLFGGFTIVSALGLPFNNQVRLAFLVLDKFTIRAVGCVVGGVFVSLGAMGIIKVVLRGPPGPSVTWDPDLNSPVRERQPSLPQPQSTRSPEKAYGETNKPLNRLGYPVLRPGRSTGYSPTSHTHEQYSSPRAVVASPARARVLDSSQVTNERDLHRLLSKGDTNMSYQARPLSGLPCSLFAFRSIFVCR